MKRAIVVVCDGLPADMMRPELAPNLARLANWSHVFTAHESVYPTTTRVNSASMATGYLPARHGLEGNCVALDEGDGLVAVSAGKPDFRDRLLRATGRTLRVPTLAERLSGHGGCVVFSNVSAGAALFQDPDGYGFVYHRQGSYGPGRVTLADGLDVTHDGAGDAAMTERFCAEMSTRPAALGLLWLCEPDHTQHAAPLGSPEHRRAIAGADACVAQLATAVAALRARGDDVLALFCSDHGHETVEAVVPLADKLVEAGLKAAPDSRDVVVASNGMSASIYMADGARPRLGALVDFLAGEDWVGEVFAGAELARLGQPTDTALAVSLSTRKSDAVNDWGVAGAGFAVADPLSSETRVGCGQHGGLGAFERHPFLFVSGGGFSTGTEASTPTSTTDIAPTILGHLGLGAEGMDGRPLGME